MTPEELQAELDRKAIERGAWVAPPKTNDPTRPLADILAVDEAAVAHARKWNLIRTDGTLKCLRDHCDGDGTLPTLECRACLARRTGT